MVGFLCLKDLARSLPLLLKMSPAVLAERQERNDHCPSRSSHRWPFLDVFPHTRPSTTELPGCAEDVRFQLLSLLRKPKFQVQSHLCPVAHLLVLLYPPLPVPINRHPLPCPSRSAVSGRFCSSGDC